MRLTRELSISRSVAWLASSTFVTVIYLLPEVRNRESAGVKWALDLGGDRSPFRSISVLAPRSGYR